MINLPIKFFHKWKRDGLIQTIKTSFNYICRKIFGINYADRANIINAFRFRDHRIFFACDMRRILPKSTVIGHGTGIVVHAKTEIGQNVLINQNVTIGDRGSKHSGIPTVEDDVEIGSGAVVLGDVTLEKGCVIGANSVVLDDVGEGKTAVGAPATEV